MLRIPPPGPPRALASSALGSPTHTAAHRAHERQAGCEAAAGGDGEGGGAGGVAQPAHKRPHQCRAQRRRNHLHAPLHIVNTPLTVTARAQAPAPVPGSASPEPSGHSGWGSWFTSLVSTETHQHVADTHMMSFTARGGGSGLVGPYA
eukprot:1196371-Prorocentrum_minimum.AAC.2